MSLRRKVKITLEDGSEIETAYDGRDMRAWEGATGKPVPGSTTSLSMLAYYAWSAAKRDGSLNGSYDKYAAFDKVCTWVEYTDDKEDEEERPTEAQADTPKEAGAASSAP